MAKETSILIIGDWFIDENWLVAQHNTYNSSHTGDIHYVSQHEDINMRLTSLCGVPEIIQILKVGEIKCNIVGLGVWNSEDDEILPCVLDPKHKEQKCFTPYKITNYRPVVWEESKQTFAEGEDQPGKERLCPYSGNLCDNVNRPDLVNLASTSQNSSTNRIIRVYEGHAGAEPHLLYRFDWELPVKSVHIDLDKLKNKIIDVGKSSTIRAIIIEDHHKGVVTLNTIKAVLEALASGQKTTKEQIAKWNSLKWYIRSKIDNPDWLQYLISKGVIIRLRTLDYKIAQKKGPRQWFFGDHLGRSSLELLGELTGDEIFEDGKSVHKAKLHTEKVAVLLDDNKVIAKDRNICFNLPVAKGPKQMINIGRTTIFFASLIVQDLQCRDNHKQIFGLQCSYAARSAFEWSKSASKAWKKSELNLYGDYQNVFGGSKNPLIYLKFKPEDLAGENVFPRPYAEIWKEWNNSSEALGIIPFENNKSVFQLWRGEGSLKGYICVGGPKRSSINEMLRSISDYHEQKNPKHTFNSLLVASPGWGKSFLAKSIANYFGMHHMEFSLSQMATADDLIECFDSICSQQNRSQEKLLIFMDEIDCNIEGHSAMGLLLGPIWDGSFSRNGKFYRLLPAVWIFASTTPISKIISEDRNKGLDFVSRLNGPVITLDSMNIGSEVSRNLDDYRKAVCQNPDGNYNDKYRGIMDSIPPNIRTEQVYIGVSLLNKNWGPIREIEKGVLQVFHDLVPINGIRSMEFFIHKFRNIQRGQVGCRNLPFFENFPELKRHILLPKDWERTLIEKLPDYHKLVSIETQINMN